MGRKLKIGEIEYRHNTFAVVYRRKDGTTWMKTSPWDHGKAEPGDDHRLWAIVDRIQRITKDEMNETVEIIE